jgi:hypothetical protein
MSKYPSSQTPRIPERNGEKLMRDIKKPQHTKRLLPFLRGYVLDPNAFCLAIKSESSPLIPFSVSVFSIGATPEIWTRSCKAETIKEMTCCNGTRISLPLHTVGAQSSCDLLSMQ